MASLRSGRQIGADGEFIGLNETERYLGNPVANGYILLANTDGTRSWVDPDSVFIAGETDLVIVKQEGTNVGTGGTNSTLDFYGNFAITQSSVGIASIRLADILNIGGLNVSGVSTFQDDVNIGVGGTTAFFDVSTGRLGIGTDNLISKLEVVGNTICGVVSDKTNYSNVLDTATNLGTAGFRTLNIIDESAVVKMARLNEEFGPALDLQHWNTDISTLYGRALVGITSANVQIDNVSEGGYIYFKTKASGAGVSTERLRITSDGVLLVGTDSTSNTKASAIFEGNPTNNVGNIAVTYSTSTPAVSDQLGNIAFGDSGHVQSAFIGAARDGGTWTSGSSQPTKLQFTTTPDGTAALGGVLRMTIKSDGKVGIATGNPSQTLDINGNARFRGAIYDNNNVVGAANSVLVSTGSGVVWKSPGAISAGIATDADLLDGLDSTQFLRSDVADTKVGVTTFQDDIFLGDNDVLNFGDSNDLQIYHDGNNSFIDDTGTGDLVISATHLRLRSAASETYLLATANSSVELYYDNAKKFETTSNGISVSNNVGIGTTLASQTLDINGNARFRGAIYDNNNVVGTANSVLVSTGSGVVWKSPGLAVGVATDADLLDGLDSTQFLRSDVADTKVGVTTFQDDVFLRDDDRLKFGDDEELQIYHDGVGSFISQSGTGNLRIGGNTVTIENSTNTANQAVFVSVAAVSLYYNGSKKFETTTTGIAITNGASTSATIAGPDEIIIDPATVGDNTGSVRIKGDLFVDGTQTIINSSTIELADFIVGIASTATTDTLADGAGIQIGPDNTFLYEYNGGTNPSLKSSENLNVATGKVYQIDQTERLSANTLSLGTGTTIHSPSSNVLTFGTNGTEKVRINSDGNFGIGTNNPAYMLDILEDTTASIVGRFNNTGNTSAYMTVQASGTTVGAVRFGATGDDMSLWTGSSESIRIKSTGRVGIGTDSPGYKLEVNGSFAATTKSFVIDHPTKDGMKLRYGSLEGPENGVYVRGRLNGNNTIELPDYWTGLVDEETITVNLTPIGRNASLHSVIDIVDNTVVVESASGEVNCFYTVFGERKDTERFEVEF